MPEALTIGALETVLFERFQKCGPYPQCLDLDLSACQFTEIVALIHLIALAADRARRGLITRFALPKSKDVRDFMRVWEFPTAIRDATGIPFSKLVLEGDLAYFGENSDLAALRYAEFNSYEGGLQRMLSSRFFAITSFLTAIPSQSRYALSESGRWRETLVRSVLSRYLSGPDNYVASRIVFEAATNAVRHPGATIIQTASTFFIPRRSYTIKGTVSSFDFAGGVLTVAAQPADVTLFCDERTTCFREVLSREGRTRRKRMPIAEVGPGQPVTVRTRARVDGERICAAEVTVLRAPIDSADADEALERNATDSGYLTIIFWDDGESIVDTLKQAILSGKSIRSVEVPDLYADFELVRCDAAGRSQSRDVVNSSYLPNKTTPEDLLLLSATFPGITRDVSGANREPNLEPPVSPLLESPGMGLFVLLNTAIDVFGGSVFFRTKHLGMSVKKVSGDPDPPNLRYTAKIREFGEHTPPLLGNMIIIRLPIRERRA